VQYQENDGHTNPAILLASERSQGKAHAYQTDCDRNCDRVPGYSGDLIAGGCYQTEGRKDEHEHIFQGSSSEPPFKQ
jgi:hypothetical protein